MRVARVLGKALGEFGDLLSQGSVELQTLSERGLAFDKCGLALGECGLASGKCGLALGERGLESENPLVRAQLFSLARHIFV